MGQESGRCVKENMMWRVKVIANTRETTLGNPHDTTYEIEHLVAAHSVDDALSLIRAHYEDDEEFRLAEVIGIEKHEETILLVGQGD